MTKLRDLPLANKWVILRTLSYQNRATTKRQIMKSLSLCVGLDVHKNTMMSHLSTGPKYEFPYGTINSDMDHWQL